MSSPQHSRERDLQHRIEAVLESVLPALEVLDVELNGPQEKVVVYIDSADGVGFAECEATSHALRDAGTCDDFELEVSSPGIERPLRSAEHFRAQLGSTVRLRQAGRHKASVVVVEGVDDEHGVTVRPDGSDARVVPFDQIVRCRLVVEDPFATPVADNKRKGRVS